jgi:hypothetical protein
MQIIKTKLNMKESRIAFIIVFSFNIDLYRDSNRMNAGKYNFNSPEGIENTEC